MTNHLIADERVKPGTLGWNLTGLFGNAMRAVNQGADLDTILEDAGLNWAVGKVPIYRARDIVEDDEGEKTGAIDVQPTHVATIRSDTFETLGIVGRTYQPVDNRVVFQLAADIVDTGGAQWLAGGSTRGGSRVQGILQLDRDLRIGGDDQERILPLMRVGTSHDGSMGVRVSVLPMRLVCLNGMLIADKDTATHWTLRHTRNVESKVMQAREALGIGFAYYDALEELGNQLVAQPLSTRGFETFVNELVPVPDRDPASPTGGRGFTIATTLRETLLDLHRNTDDIANVRGTAWGALQTITRYVTHDQPMRAAGRPSTDIRFERVSEHNTLLDRAHAMLVRA